MINGKRIAVVMPAYNAAKTLVATVAELPDLVDIRILVDDHSNDETVEVAHQLGLLVYRHDRNYGYGRNQQTCYREALAAGADVVIMLHPDYQYTPLLATAMASWLPTMSTMLFSDHASSEAEHSWAVCRSINTYPTA